jgi:hypothetical protein
MPSLLPQLKKRVEDLDLLADEVFGLAQGLSTGVHVQPELSQKGQKWYRGARELMRQQEYSGLGEFDECYSTTVRWSDISRYISTEPDDPHATKVALTDGFRLFKSAFLRARALVASMEDELLARELPVTTQLSLAVSASELDTAEAMLLESKGIEEVFMRASGVIARVSLERHLFTVAENRKITIDVNPPSKKKADVEDVLQALQKNRIITAIQKSQLDGLFKVANNCAHPRESVTYGDVERLIRDGKQLAAVIL